MDNIVPKHGNRLAIGKFLQFYKLPIIFTLFTLMTSWFFMVGIDDATSSFILSARNAELPWIIELSTPLYSFISGTLLIVITVLAFGLRLKQKNIPFWLSIGYCLIILFGFLVLISADARLQLASLLSGAIALSAPIIFGALGGIISERVGVVNIAIEGQLLAGAFLSAVVATITGNPYLGLLGAVVAGILVSLLLTLFAIKYLVDQVIVGVVVNVLVIGLTNFLSTSVLAKDKAGLNDPQRFEAIAIPYLSDIPLIGPIFFDHSIIIYAMYIMVIAVYLGLFYTTWGLRLRAVGEHPKAADTVGINVNRTRFLNVLLAGAIAGFGGAFFTLGSVGAFDREMSQGLGFIALAAVIFGKWHPLKATAAALLFGFTSNLHTVIGATGSTFSSEFLLMLPYAITIFAVAGLVGKSNAPAAAGKPYA